MSLYVCIRLRFYLHILPQRVPFGCEPDLLMVALKGPFLARCFVYCVKCLVPEHSLCNAQRCDTECRTFPGVPSATMVVASASWCCLRGTSKRIPIIQRVTLFETWLKWQKLCSFASYGGFSAADSPFPKCLVRGRETGDSHWINKATQLAPSFVC